MVTTLLLATTLQPGQPYSAPAVAARDAVLALVTGPTTRLHVLSVYAYATIQTHGLPADVAATYRDAQMQRIETCLKRQLDAYITPFIARGLQVAKLLRVGKPKDIIVHAAAELNADLLLIGMPSKRGRYALTLGRTTRYIRQHAPCPVLLVSPRGDGCAG